MLVFPRELNETFSIEIPPSTEPGRIVIKILRIGGKAVRVGVIAPKEMAIDRPGFVKGDATPKPPESSNKEQSMDALKIAEAVAKAEPKTPSELRKVIADAIGGEAPDFFNMTLTEAVAFFGSIKVGDLLRSLTAAAG